MAPKASLQDEGEDDDELPAQINAVLAAEDGALEAWLAEAGRRVWDAVEWRPES